MGGEETSEDAVESDWAMVVAALCSLAPHEARMTSLVGSTTRRGLTRPWRIEEASVEASLPSDSASSASKSLMPSWPISKDG